MSGGFLRATFYSPLIKEGVRQSEHFEVRVGLYVSGVKQELQDLSIMGNTKPPFYPTHGAKELRGQKKMGCRS